MKHSGLEKKKKNLLALATAAQILIDEENGAAMHIFKCHASTVKKSSVMKRGLSARTNIMPRK
jgi:hypothetical protein